MRQAMLDATNEQELTAVIRSVVWAATLRKDKYGNIIPPDMAAARLYLEMIVGKAHQQVGVDLGLPENELADEDWRDLKECAERSALRVVQAMQNGSKN